MTDAAIELLKGTDRPVRKSVRRLRWFRSSFREQVRQITADTGVVFQIDDRRLAKAFIEGLRAFEAQKPASVSARRAYVGFAAGLILRMLVQHKPLSVVSKPVGADASNPAYFWPEGYVYVAYCLNIRSAVLQQDFLDDQKTAPELSQIRVWWSFKENVAEDPSLGIAFLDLFAGETPHWTMPDVFRGDDLQAIAQTFYERRVLERFPSDGTI